MENPRERIREIEKRLAQLPKGALTYKTINGKKQPYVQRTVDGRSVSYYVKVSERAQILMEFAERKRLVEERKHLLAYREGLAAILKKNPYLDMKVGCGYQDFRDFACGRQFYVDKTHFIAEWLRSESKVTLITRPRRFGKTTLLSTVVFGRCKILEDQDMTLELVRKVAEKYYPNETLIDEEIARSGKAVRIYEITIEHISGKEIQEK